MQFTREKLIVNGVNIVMLTAGKGDPLLFFHGAGTWHGFEFAKPWTEKFRVMIPYHPGWGESDDSAEITSIHDLKMHYMDLIDQLELTQVNLVGLSMGARLAASFASEHRRRVKKLVLVAPAGLDVPGYPLTDFSKVPPEEIPSFLVEDMSVLTPHLANAGSVEWQAQRAREGAHTMWMIEHDMIDPKFSRWLHRLTMPTLIVWGEKDRVTPVQQSAAWMKAIPGAKLLNVPSAGHLVLDEKPSSVAAITDFLAA